MNCPRCNAPISPSDVYCEHCGVRLSWAKAGCVGCGSSKIGLDGYCEDCGRAQPTDRDRVELDLGDVAGGVTDKGRRRRRNEDAMACAYLERADGVAVVAVVCDGVASVQRGDEASQIAVQTASELLLSAAKAAPDSGPDAGPDSGPDSGIAYLREATVEAARRAGAAVAALAAEDGAARETVAQPDAGPPSSTYVSAVITGTQVVVGWIGDSRAYWLGERSTRLTTDHALNGMLTRWLGADAGEGDAQVGVFEPDGPGVVLVCSDGLWNYLPEPAQLAEVALPAAEQVKPLAVAEALTQRALDAGGRDNITVVVVPFPPAPLPSADEPEDVTEQM